ncbi:hypothetical protein N7533_001824 [Penicillium manginii]|uniref:uncharacterized protein n=1 Tax=Penicillium manginii TaxID=203109 RepID=UPI002546FD0C|nr:uncharacterized protein N7533_001824 [Penicillium manginii]KAJ5763143.1 hypothetical protein N7533_001824 [Penicillium manginii]
MTHTSKSISTLTGDVIIRDNDPDDSNLEDDEDLQDDKEPDGGVYGPQLYSGHRFSDHPPIHRIGKVEPPPGTSIANTTAPSIRVDRELEFSTALFYRKVMGIFVVK